MNYIPVAIDFETTDKDPMVAKAVEVAMHTLDGVDREFFIDPGCPIPPETSAIHHIIDDDVAGEADWNEAQDAINSFLHTMVSLDNADGILLIAHNAAYEQAVLRNTKFTVPVIWVCTYKVAMVVFPTAPSYGNEALRYWIPLEGLGRSQSHRTHSALHDAKVTMQIFKHMLGKKLPDGDAAISVEDMIQISARPAQLPRIPFGKHKGAAWDKVPTDYLQWLIRQQDMSDDVKFCATQELNKRFKIK